MALFIKQYFVWDKFDLKKWCIFYVIQKLETIKMSLS